MPGGSPARPAGGKVQGRRMGAWRQAEPAQQLQCAAVSPPVAQRRRWFVLGGLSLRLAHLRESPPSTPRAGLSCLSYSSRQYMSGLLGPRFRITSGSEMKKKARTQRRRVPKTLHSNMQEVGHRRRAARSRRRQFVCEGRTHHAPLRAAPPAPPD